MNATHTTNAKKRSLSVILIAGALSATAALGIAAPASAAAGSPSGNPGTITYNTPMTAAKDIQIMSGSIPLYYEAFVATGITVGGSAATSSTQSVTVRYVLQRYYNGRWTDWTYSPTWSASITAGQPWAAFGAFALVANPVGPGYYRVLDQVTWRSGTAFLGSMTLYPNRAGDNACRTTWLRCVAYPDFFWVE